MDGFHRFILGCFNVLYPIKIFGKENIPEGGAVLCCNHFRAIDCGFVADVYSKDIKFLAKKELFSNKLLAGVIKRFGGIAVDRDNMDIKTLFSIIKYAKEGHKLCIFPEGTRNKSGTDELQELKQGTALIAVKAKVPILPLMILKKAKLFRKTYLLVGKPFEFTEFYDKKLTDDDIAKMSKILREKMISTQAELKEIIKSKKKGKKKNANNKG